MIELEGDRYKECYQGSSARSSQDLMPVIYPLCDRMYSSSSKEMQNCKLSLCSVCCGSIPSGSSNLDDVEKCNSKCSSTFKSK